MTKQSKIVIIGGGNLGNSIAEGLLIKNAVERRNLSVIEKNIDRAKWLTNNKLNVYQDYSPVQKADVILIVVQPQQLKQVLKEVKEFLTDNKQIIASTVTGVSLDQVTETIEVKNPIFRVMPNTAMSVQESMTFITTKNANKTQTQTIVDLFSKLGDTVEINEDLMSSATVLGASATAFALRYIRAAAQGGTEIGFEAEIATKIAVQVVKGAARLMEKEQAHPEKEIDKVTTPNGCTIKGLNEMENEGFSAALIKGISAAHNRVKEISKENS